MNALSLLGLTRLVGSTVCVCNLMAKGLKCEICYWVETLNFCVCSLMGKALKCETYYWVELSFFLNVASKPTVCITANWREIWGSGWWSAHGSQHRFIYLLLKVTQYATLCHNLLQNHRFHDCAHGRPQNFIWNSCHEFFLFLFFS